MLIIFPLDDVSCEVMQTYRTFAETYATDIKLLESKISLLPPGNEITFWRKLSMAHIDDQLNHVLKWAAPTNHFNNLLTEMFPGYCIDNKPVVSSNRRHEMFARRLAEKQNEYEKLLREYNSRIHNSMHTPHQASRYHLCRTVIESVQAGNRLKECATQIQCLTEILRLHTTKVELVDVAAIEHISEKFYIDVISPVHEHINQWIDTMLGEDTDAPWKIWHVRTMGNDVIMESGIDYRIYDWERRTQSGEWEYNEETRTDGRGNHFLS